MGPTIGIQRAQQHLEALNFHGFFGGSQPPDGAAGRQRQAKAAAAMAEPPAFELGHIDRQMADMMTAREVVLEGLKLLAMPYQVRRGSFQWFLVFSHRIVRFLRHWRSLRLWASFLCGGKEVMPVRGVQRS